MYDNLNYTGGNWAVEWIAANPTHELTKLTTGTTGYSGCTGCAHSDSPTQANLNCVLKGRAAWWLWARLRAGAARTETSTTTLHGTTTTITGGSTTTTTVRRFPCPAAQILGDDRQSLSALREFRDTRLAPTINGRLFIILYYMHAHELTSLLENNDTLRDEARELLADILQRLSACRYGTCSAALSEDTLNRIDSLIDEIEPLASLRLRMSMAFVQHKIHSGELLRSLSAE